jgi:hypothetical protein
MKTKKLFFIFTLSSAVAGKETTARMNVSKIFHLLFIRHELKRTCFNEVLLSLGAAGN